MSSSNCCFLTCVQVYQEAGQVVWYSHFFQNFPQFIVIHTGKGFGIVNKVEIDVFLELSCFFHDPVDVGNLIFGSCAFSKTSLNIRKFTFTYCWRLAWRILSITLVACEMSALVVREIKMEVVLFRNRTEQASDLPGHCLIYVPESSPTATSKSHWAFDESGSEAWNFLNPLEPWPAPRVWKILWLTIWNKEHCKKKKKR